jgi:hypothetical protein
MTATRTELDRWIELTTRQATGEPLSDDERTFIEDMIARDEACAREAELLFAIGDIDAAPDASTRAMVDSALQAMEAEHARAQQDELQALRPNAKWRWLASGVMVTSAAAAAAWMLFAKPVQDIQIPASRVTLASAAPTRVELVFASGAVTINGGAPDGSLIRVGDEISVGNGSACVAIDPEIDVCLDRDTKARIAELTRENYRVDLLEGRAAVTLSPLPEGMHMSVVADGVWSTAVGTSFVVTKRGDERNTLVLNGKVRVGTAEKSALVLAHQIAQTPKQTLHQATVPEAVSRSDEAPAWDLLAPTALWKGPVSATLQLHNAPYGAEIVLDGHVLGPAPLTTLVPSGAHTLEVHSPGAPNLREETSLVPGQVWKVDYAAWSARISQPAVEVPTPRSARSTSEMRQALAENVAHRNADAWMGNGVSALLATAREHMRASNWIAAAQGYDAVRTQFPASPEAQTVLVPLAGIELEHLNQPEQALAHAERYLGAGGGVLAEEARYTRVRALRALGRSDLEARAIAELIAAHPDSFHLAPLKQRLVSLSKP